MNLDGHILLVRHTGKIPVSLLIDDIDVEFNSRQPYEVRTYIPFEETVEIPLSQAVLLSVLQGSLKKFSDSGFVSYALKGSGGSDSEGDGNFEEYLYDGEGIPSTIVLWEDSTRSKKIEESQFTYDGSGRVTEEVVITYGSGGEELLRRVHTYTYGAGDSVESIETEVLV